MDYLKRSEELIGEARKLREKGQLDECARKLEEARRLNEKALKLIIDIASRIDPNTPKL